MISEWQGLCLGDSVNVMSVSSATRSVYSRHVNVADQITELLVPSWLLVVAVICRWRIMVVNVIYLFPHGPERYFRLTRVMLVLRLSSLK